jgi:hypothetical protein
LCVDSEGQTFFEFGRGANAKYFAALVFPRINDFADESLDSSWFGSAGACCGKEVNSSGAESFQRVRNQDVIGRRVDDVVGINRVTGKTM